MLVRGGCFLLFAFAVWGVVRCSLCVVRRDLSRVCCVGCLLFVECYMLIVGWCWLLGVCVVYFCRLSCIFRYALLLLVVLSGLFFACCLKCAEWCLLFVGCCVLFAVCFVLCVACCVLRVARCLLFVCLRFVACCVLFVVD